MGQQAPGEASRQEVCVAEATFEKARHSAELELTEVKFHFRCIRMQPRQLADLMPRRIHPREGPREGIDPTTLPGPARVDRAAAAGDAATAAGRLAGASRQFPPGGGGRTLRFDPISFLFKFFSGDRYGAPPTLMAWFV